ncbi:MAG: hypothetical protein ABIR24_13075, partial [Verrucomicrobiota bacterium]
MKLLIFILFSWCGSVLLPAENFSSFPFRLEKNTRWIYEGKISWTKTVGSPQMHVGVKTTNACGSSWKILKNKQDVITAKVRWIMDVLETKENDAIHAAVIRGYPAELAWSEAGTEPNFCVQFGTTNRLWSVPAASKS